MPRTHLMNISSHQVKFINYCLSEGYFDPHAKYTVKYMLKFFLTKKTFDEFISGNDPLIAYAGGTEINAHQEFVKFTKRGRKLIEAGNWFIFLENEKSKTSRPRR